MSVKVGINGVGRIGKGCIRAALDNPNVEVVAINTTREPELIAHLLKYDSIYGRLNANIEVEDKALIIDGKKITILADRNPANLNWGDCDVDIVIEATGRFRRRAEAAAHLNGGARRVVISAPSPDCDLTVVMGVNERDYNPQEHIVLSNASCTTNALAPLVKVIHEHFCVEQLFMTTVHAYTNDQHLLDLGHSDYRRARAAAVSMIPTTTGAAQAVTKVIPELSGKLDGMAVRVPSAAVSMIDLVVRLRRDVTAQGINDVFAAAAMGQMHGIIDVSNEPLVSADYRGSSFSSTVDALSTMVIGGNLAKIIAWYDNEWGYCCRLLDLAAYIGAQERIALK
ncbi:MAG: type I glyceraldehyde-3-phosphate dehydrogenase [Dethiobacteria bacterium]|jgi:glyceraldehyde 3-phosphate dehydrogenase|nr:type I glyceraldehyde-3-phosphate dehydrogenase [Bacillota bacterium]